jgi:Trp operon repressor
LPENQQALDIWQEIKAFGSELVFTLLDLKLTKLEAEELLHKLTIIQNIIDEFQSQKGD